MCINNVGVKMIQDLAASLLNFAYPTTNKQMQKKEK